MEDSRVVHNKSDSFSALATALGQRLVDAGALFATAESCTGGWVAKVCTDIPGSSRWFDRGFVTYSNRAKEELLGVEVAIIEGAGAVSESTVRAMAKGALARSQAHLAVAVSGIAGPGGGTAEKPVGTVWFAWASRAGLNSEVVHFAGDREAIRRQSVAHILRRAIEAPLE